MSGEKLKVLELVSDGKITPEEGVRLIEALGEADRKSGAPSPASNHVFGGQRFNPFGMGEVKIPKIDLGNLGEVLVEVKNNVVDMGKKAEAGFRRSRANRFFEMSDYSFALPRHDGLDHAYVKLEVSAGKLRLRAAERGGDDLLAGNVKRTPDEPSYGSQIKDGRIEAHVKCSIGRGSLSLNPDLHYTFKLANAAADAKLELASLQVDELELDNHAGNLSIELGERTERVKIKVENNAGSVRLAVPANFALRVVCSSNFSNHNFEKYGLELTDGTAQSGDWADNPRGVEIKLNQHVASFQLDWQRRDGVSVGYNPSKHNSNEDAGHSEGEWRSED